MLIKLARTLKAGGQNFVRNGWLTVATVSVIVIALFIINVQLAIVVANGLLLEDVKGRVNISAYIDSTVSEGEIEKMKKEIEAYPEVKKVDYVSRETAFENFKQRNQENDTIKKAIEEIGENPLRASLNIQAHNPDQYDEISARLEAGQFAEKIDKINYYKYRSVIDNLNSEIGQNQRVAIVLALTLSAVAILITFNSIRITMYAHRKEVEIMRLVGASNGYIRMPFVWEGIFYGLIAVVVTVPLVYFYLDFVASGEATNSILPFSNARFVKVFLTDYYLRNLHFVILAQFFFGMFLGVISSVIAIRKYLKV